MARLYIHFMARLYIHFMARLYIHFWRGLIILNPKTKISQGKIFQVN